MSIISSQVRRMTVALKHNQTLISVWIETKINKTTICVTSDQRYKSQITREYRDGLPTLDCIEFSKPVFYADGDGLKMGDWFDMCSFTNAILSELTKIELEAKTKQTATAIRAIPNTNILEVKIH